MYDCWVEIIARDLFFVGGGCGFEPAHAPLTHGGLQYK